MTQDVYSVTTPEATDLVLDHLYPAQRGRARCLAEMSQPGFINPSLANVRKGWDDIFSEQPGARNNPYPDPVAPGGHAAAEALFALSPGRTT